MDTKTPPSPQPGPDSQPGQTSAMPAAERSLGAAQRMSTLVEMLFEHNPDCIMYSDDKGNLLLNQAAKSLQSKSAPLPTDMSEMAQWSRSYGIFLPDGKTPFPPEDYPLTRALIKREVVLEQELILKNPEHPSGQWLSASATPLPNGQAFCVYRDITERKRLEEALAQRNAELAAQMVENSELIERLRLSVDELSTPVLELWDDVLALPVVGVVDTVRSSRMMEKALSEVVSRRCRFVIIDLTGVDVIDTSTADRFIKLARAIELLGADCVISGVQPAVAQTMTDLGVSFRGLVTQRNLKRALDFCIGKKQQEVRRAGA